MRNIAQGFSLIQTNPEPGNDSPNYEELLSIIYSLLVNLVYLEKNQV